MIRRKRDKKGRFTSDIVSIFVKDEKKFKICTMCKKEKEISEFYWIKKKDSPTSRCKKCTDEINKKNKHKYTEYFTEYNKKHRIKNKEKNKRHYIKKKIEWIRFISTITDIKCKKCGYNKYYDALDFHHENPSTKENILSILTKLVINEKRKNQVIKELSKGYFLCANCHREEHMINKIKIKEYLKE